MITTVPVHARGRTISIGARPSAIIAIRVSITRATIGRRIIIGGCWGGEDSPLVNLRGEGALVDGPRNECEESLLWLLSCTIRGCQKAFVADPRKELNIAVVSVGVTVAESVTEWKLGS